jgi:DNA (cytosine-5)-methyltransferase 1
MTQDRGVAISLFSGAGGLNLGAEAAGFKVMAAVESDHNAADTMEKNFFHLHTRYPVLDLVQIVLRQPLGRF